MKRWLVLAVLIGAFVLAAAPAAAHEGREVGHYEIELGWRVEPAYVGVYNGPEIFVHDHNTEEPVAGLEATLQLMVHFGDEMKMLALYPVWNDPGHYTADLIPTRPGDYTFHIMGMIGDLMVDEAFTSADGQFGTVEPAADILFPAAPASAEVAALQVQIDALKAQLDQLSAAQSK